MQILSMLPEPIRGILRRTNLPLWELREIRLRIHRGLLLQTAKGEYLPAEDGAPAGSEREAYRVTEADIKRTLELLTGYSVYAFEDSMRQGYFTVEGGHRVGVAGRVVSEAGRVLRMQNITFLNLRIAHEIKGCSNVLFERLYGDGTLCHTLLFAPAGCGKTTFLRDLIRLLSDSGRTVGVADERSELGAARGGIPQHDLGLRTDVMDGCSKSEGMVMLLRSMTPQVLAADEIGLAADVEAIRAAAGSGCYVLATAHGGSLEEVKKNPMLRILWEERRFFRYVQLGKTENGFGVVDIFDEEGKRLGT